MKLFKKSNGVNMQFVDECVRSFFSVVNDTDYTGVELSELFRHSMCAALELDSIIGVDDMSEISKIVTNNFRSICKKYNIPNDSYYRQALLEAGVHCIELSRKKAGE